MGLLSLGSCPNCLSSANIVAEIQFKLLNERVLSTGEPCTCEYVTLLQSFHRGALSIHWYISYLDALLRLLRLYECMCIFISSFHFCNHNGGGSTYFPSVVENK